MSSQTFTIYGMVCEACTKLSVKRIKKIEGVLDASVDLGTKIALVRATRPITTNEINAMFTDGEYRAEDNYDKNN